MAQITGAGTVQGPAVQGPAVTSAGGQTGVLANQTRAAAPLPRTGGLSGWLLRLAAGFAVLGVLSLVLVRRLRPSGA